MTTRDSSKNFIQPFLLALFLAGGLLLGIFLAPSSSRQVNQESGRLKEVLSLIDGFYVDTIDQNDIEEKAIAELLKKLDPHSVFIAAKDIQAISEPLEGEFEGIGVEFNVLEDTIYIVNVIPGGPSDKAGLQAGDRIIKVEDTLVAGVQIQNDEVIKKLKGPKGTKVHVSILRHRNEPLMDYEITRGTIPVHSVETAYMMDDKTGYIRLLRFSATTAQEVHEALVKLNEKGMKSLVFDLRGNPGGYLNAATEVADEFLSGDKLIVYTKGRIQPKKEVHARHKGAFEDGKLIVLVDEHSASASEIVSGAVQDWDRGLVVGRRSYGKGLVQEQFELSDKSVVRLTIARYYTPTNRSIQKPYSNGYDNYQMEVYERWEHGEMEVHDSVKSVDSLRYTTPSGRYVYGGGGIYPDIFVPVDTSFSRTLVAAIYAKSLQRKFVYHYIDEHKGALKRFSDAKSFIKLFAWTANDLAEFKTLMHSEQIEPSEYDWTRTEDYLLLEMKALLARQLFGVDAYYMVSNKNDKAIDAALKGLLHYEESFIAGADIK
ncbi:MAG: PDZ domain-containing protein [Bacteroidetes bacterium]|nr:MAG: PDZ domain-containing protein [Bacteroidota bacterium]